MESIGTVILERCASPADFLRRAEPFLLAHEARHCLILGLAAGLARQPPGDTPPYLAVVRAGDAMVAAALRTPPHNVILSEIAAEHQGPALNALVGDLSGAYPNLPGVLGPRAIAADFVARWQRASGQASHLARAERIYQAMRITPPPAVPGALRPASTTDRDLLVAWFVTFHQEAGLALDSYQTMAVVTQRLSDPASGFALWCDGEPVALVSYSGPTRHGIRIGPVYTPPAYRRQGYASAAVAALSQQLLDAGRRVCFLFTDLANPTANHIYQAIGYQPVRDMDEYHFTTPAMK